MIESLSYYQIAERLGVSHQAARALVKRLRLPRSMGNNGSKTLVQVDLSEINHTVRAPRKQDPSVVAALTARVEELEKLITFERGRGDDLLAQLLKATADLAVAKLQQPQPWWKLLRISKAA